MKTLLTSILSLVTAVSSGLAAETTGEIGPITTQRVIDSKSQHRFTMQIPIQFHSKEKIDTNGVMLQVAYYDLVDGKPVPTNAEISPRLKTPSPTWADGGTVVFNMEYNQPATNTPETSATRSYFGYIVRVYYQNELKATQSEPKSLAATFPAPQTIKSE